MKNEGGLRLFPFPSSSYFNYQTVRESPAYPLNQPSHRPRYKYALAPLDCLPLCIGKMVGKSVRDVPVRTHCRATIHFPPIKPFTHHLQAVVQEKYTPLYNVCLFPIFLQIFYFFCTLSLRKTHSNTKVFEVPYHKLINCTLPVHGKSNI